MLDIVVPQAVERRWSGASLAGLAGVVCSAMIYADTRRPFWDIAITLPKFFGTAAYSACPLRC